MSAEKPISNITALKRFFEPPAIGMQELNALSKEERADLADQVFAVTGWARA